MVKVLSEVLNIEENQLSIKAKTNEQMDAVGEKKAIEANAVVMLRKEK
ncbi:2-C-methyl-D-erythritol 2,4-cyclodiphosphate synthase [Kiloniella laminariae]